MEYYSSHINKLIEQLSHLPGVGAPSAQRLAFLLLTMLTDQVEQLPSSITGDRENVQYCKCCCTLTDREICPICSNDKRDHSVIMVVENTRDLAAYEKTGKFDGVYHVLHGAISPMLGIGPDDIKLKELMQRLAKDEVKEVIIATNSSLEGETTAMEQWENIYQHMEEIYEDLQEVGYKKKYKTKFERLMGKCTAGNDYAAVKATNMLNDDIYKSIKQILVSEGVWTSNLQEMENEIQDISLKMV